MMIIPKMLNIRFLCFKNDQDREAKVAIAALGNEQSATADRYTAIKNLATFAIGLL